MKLSTLSERLGSDAETAWRVHNMARDRVDRGDDIIILSIGEEAAETTADVIVEQAVASLRGGRHHYSDVRGPAKLRQIISQRHTSQTGQKVTAEQCTMYAGCQNSLFAIAQCVLDANDEVILPEPYYSTYPGVFTATGAKAVKVQGHADRLYLCSVDQIAAAVNDRTRAIVITQPGNPIGTFYTTDELHALADLCRAHNLWLISDEVYTTLLAPEDRCSPATHDEAGDFVVTVGSLSKSNRMTGWRVGWTVTPEPLAKLLAELSMIMHYGLPPFIMDAAITALEQDQETTEHIRQSMNARRQVCKDILENIPNARLLDSGAGMFVVLDVSETGQNAESFAIGLLEQHAVATLPCASFGENCDYLLRIGLCVSDEQLRDACHRIATYAASL